MSMCAWTGLLAACLIATPLRAADAPDGTAKILQDLLRIDTTNAPGDTRPAADYLKRLFDQAGIENRIILAPNGKAAHFVARLRGDGSKRPLLIAAHTDVVPADTARWSVDPFAGAIKDGYLWGRGALDNKGAVAAFAATMLRLKAEGTPLVRDVIFLAEADEEQGQYNTSWLFEQHPKLIDAEFALNEGGVILVRDGKVRQLTVTYADKISLNIRVRARGPSGHSSRPLPIGETANGQLITALDRLQRLQAPIMLSPATRDYLLKLGAVEPGPLRTAITRLLGAREAGRSAAAEAVIAADTGGWGLEGALRDTLVVTMISAGVKPNVIPGSAEATLNARLLPGGDAAAFVERLRQAIGNGRVEVSIASALPADQAAAFYAARAAIPNSTLDTDLYRAIGSAAEATWPDAAVLPTVFVATTDAVAWRQRGIPVYGISPFAVEKADVPRIHGEDERVALAAIDDGVAFIHRIVAAAAGKTR